MNVLLFIYYFAFNIPNKLMFFNNIHDKKISYKTIFDNKINIYKKNSYNKLIEINNDCINIQKDYCIKDIIANEVDFLLNKKIKVYIHLEQLFSNTNIYHIGITFKTIIYKVRFDIGTFERYNLNILKINRKTKKIFWGYTNRSLEEIIDYEKNIEYKYFLGIYDCRHYVNNLTQWSCNKATPIWQLYKYY